MQVRFKALPTWPHKETPADARRPASTFAANFNTTLAELEHELEQLGAHDVVIEAGFTAADIRIDGWPKANARPLHPGVIVYFESRHGPLRYQTDRHALWQHNLRAIALGLKALRAVDRYGISERAEQYQGWAALPAGTDHATAVLFTAVGETPRQLANGETEKLFRRALHATHPDRGGSDERVREVLDAGAALGLR